jgi:transketolase
METLDFSRLANALRFLSIDAVNQANSGHPGMPMGMSTIATALWHKFMNHNPKNPSWPNRDRFILSNGHGSMLLYSLLHLTGYDLSLEDLKQFRQMNSKTPGHPEYHITPGVETTTGPLGQGFANAVGMALAEKLLAKEFNRPQFNLIDHFTYVFAGDGCLMEGVSHEAASLAASFQLSKLVVFYDDNQISIDGKTSDWMKDDTKARFSSYGWNVLGPINGHDVSAVIEAIEQAKRLATSAAKPTLIICKTEIGFGSPNRKGTAKAHGEPLGAEETQKARETLGWKYAPFEVPDDIRKTWDATDVGRHKEANWQETLSQYAQTHKGLFLDFVRRLNGDLTPDWVDTTTAAIQGTVKNRDKLATRKASQMALNYFGSKLSELLGGSADLTSSNLTQWEGSLSLKTVPDFVPGRHIHWGVREFAMTAALNGVALHGGFIPFGGTFLTFSDYSRPAIRLAALMGIRNIFVFTHDSIGVGEDGPTHQPIEHINSLRMIPHLDVWRPADITETFVAWRCAIERIDGPSALLFSRQAVAAPERTLQGLSFIAKGGYILYDAPNPQIILIATGTELEITIEAQKMLAAASVRVRLVSMPCTRRFENADEAYRNSVLPKEIPKIAVEAGNTLFWKAFVGDTGFVFGIDTFGLSAPAAQLYEFFGLTPKAVAQKAMALLRPQAPAKPASNELSTAKSKAASA